MAEVVPIDELGSAPVGEGKRTAEQIKTGRGPVEDVSGQLAAELDKVTFRAASGEGPESVAVEVSDAEAQDKNPRLAALKIQYEALSRADLTCSKGVMTWEQVVAAIPNMNEFLAGIDSLSEAEVYWLDNEGQLVVGDGCVEPAPETFRHDGEGLNYYDSRVAAMEVPNRGLITFDEYKRKNKGQFEVSKRIWVEGGKTPLSAQVAFWGDGRVQSAWGSPYDHDDDIGSRRVLRVKLNLES